jgi:Holliday junction resolvase RusA-like endonuclease
MTTLIDDTYWYVLHLNPEPWAIGPVGTSRRGGKMVSYVGQNKQLNAYKEAVKEEIESQEPVFIEGNIDLTFFFWRNRADYTTPQSRTHRKHEADVTNLQKATEDALQGVLFKNDKDNTHVESFMMDQGPDVEGCIVVRIRQAPDWNPLLMLSANIWNQVAEGNPHAP